MLTQLLQGESGYSACLSMFFILGYTIMFTLHCQQYFNFLLLHILFFYYYILKTHIFTYSVPVLKTKSMVYFIPYVQCNFLSIYYSSIVLNHSIDFLCKSTISCTFFYSPVPIAIHNTRDIHSTALT